MNSIQQELSAVSGRAEKAHGPTQRAPAIVDEIPLGADPSTVLRLTDRVTSATSDATVPQPRLMLPRIRVDVFASSPALLATAECVSTDRRAVRSEFTVCRGGFVEALERYRVHAPPDLVVIEDRSGDAELELRIESLAEYCPPATRLVIIGDRNDVVLYRRLIKIGVSDYLVQPVSPLSLLDAIATIVLDDTEAKDLGLVVAFVGARGGVGSSTIAHNAAAIFSRDFDATTLLIDADIGFGTAALQFDISTSQGLADALTEREDLDGETLERFAHWRDKRLGILTAPDRVDQMISPEPGMIRHIIDQSRRIAKYVVLDVPHGWALHTVEAIASADRVFVVATPDLPSLRNTRMLLELIQKLRPNDEPAQLVLNRMPAKVKPPVSKEDFVRILDRKIASILPSDDAALSAEMAGNVLAEDAPKCEFARAIALLIAEITGREPQAMGKAAKKSLFARFFSRGA